MTEIFFSATENDNSEIKNKIFAGDWCFFSNIKQIEKKNNICSKELFLNDKKSQNEIEDLKIFFFKEIKNNLNNLHKDSYSDKFWKFLLEPWLSYFIDSNAMKWKIIQDIETKYSKIYFNKYKNLKQRYFFDVRDYQKNFEKDDKFHQKQFQNLIEFKSKFNSKYHGLENDKIFLEKKNDFKKSHISSFVRKSLNSIINYFLRNNNYFIFNSSLGILNHIILNFKLKQFPHILFEDFKALEYEKYYNNSFNLKLRDKIKINLNTKDELKSFLSEAIIHELPTCYLENFKILIEKSKKIKINSKIIISSTEILHNTLFKFWAALMQETKKSIIVCPDHGGTLGVYDHLCWLDYIDYRFTWHKPIYQPDIQMPSFHLSKINNSRVSPNAKLKNLLFISHNRIKYYHSFFNSPNGYDSIKTTGDFKLLTNKISNEIKKNFFVKPYNDLDHDYWIKNKLWLNLEDKSRIIMSKKDYKKIFNNSKIIICNYPKTALCEAMISGPTIMLFKTNEWLQTELFMKIKERLINCNILFENGDHAADHINNIWDNPLDWWNSKDVKKTREDFSKLFTMVSQRPINNWLEELNKINKNINF